MKQQGFIQVLLVLVALTACGQITNTIYVPSMVHMADEFSVAPSSIQAVMALYLIPYGLSQFLYGPLSDRFGRKPLMLIGLVVFIMGSLVASNATTFHWLLIGSFIQGMGTGVGGVMSRTVMRDLYSGSNLQKANSYISMALIFTPLMAPLVGGLLGSYFGWAASFWFLTGFGLLTWLLVCFRFQETHEKRGHQTMNPIKSYKHVLSHRQSNGFMITLVATFSGVAVFEAAAGVLFGGIMGIDTKIVSLLFVIPIPGYLFGSWLAGRLINQYALEHIIGYGAAMLALASGSMLLAALLGYMNVLVIILPTLLYFFGAGLIFPTATTAALEPMPDNAGVAGAVLGGAQNLGAGIVTLVSANFSMHSQLPLAAILCVLTLLVIMIFRLQLSDASVRTVLE